MKKILAFLSVLFVGLLVGCASKSESENTTATIDNTDNIIYETEINNDNDNIIEEAEINDDTDIFIEVMNINQDCLIKADKTVPWPGYTFQEINCDFQALAELTCIPEFWNLPENVMCENPVKYPIIGRIINNTDKEDTFWLVYKHTNCYEHIYLPDYYLEIKVPAKSIRYYIYDKPEMPTDRGGGVFSNIKGGKGSGYFSPESFGGRKNWDLATKIINEIMSKHYEEIILNSETDSDGNNYYYRLVEPFEYNEEDLISDWVVRE